MSAQRTSSATGVGSKPKRVEAMWARKLVQEMYSGSKKRWPA